MKFLCLYLIYLFSTFQLNMNFDSKNLIDSTIFFHCMPYNKILWQILLKLQFLLFLFEFLLREGSFWNTLNVCNTQWRIDFIVVLQQHSLFLKNTSKVHLFIISDSFKRILTWPFKEFAKEEKNVKIQLREKSVRGYLFLIQFFVSI